MKDYLNTMLISPKRVKESGELNLNVDDGAIGTSIRTAQGVYLVDVLGKDLVEKVQELVYAKVQGASGGTIDTEENIPYKTLLTEYITPVLISQTIIDIALRNSLKIRNMGVVQNSDTNVNAATLSEIHSLQNYQETMLNHHLNRMVEFICENKAAFPEADFVCGCKPTRKYANTNLWLG